MSVNHLIKELGEIILKFKDLFWEISGITILDQHNTNFREQIKPELRLAVNGINKHTQTCQTVLWERCMIGYETRIQ